MRTRIATWYDPDHGHGLVTQGHVIKAHVLGQLAHSSFVLGERVGMHQDNSQTSDTLVKQRLQVLAQLFHV